MGRLILPDEASYLQFQKNILALQFKQIGKKEFENDFHRLNLQAPRSKEGREAGYEFFSNGLRVKVWTTFLEEKKEARPSDLGWVLITKGDDAQYFAHPMRRTKNFFANLLAYAKACKERISARPVCKDKNCRRMFEIEKSAGGGRYWRCSNTELHGKQRPREKWDYGLSAESMAFMKVERAEKARYRAKRRKQGKTIGKAKIIRKKWKIGTPQNKMP